MKKSNIIILIGLIEMLISSIGFIILIVVLPKSNILGEGEGAAILTAIIYTFGSIIASFLVLTGMIFLRLHTKYGRSEKVLYLWVLLVISVVVVLLSTIYFINVFMRLPVFGFVIISTIAVGFGLLLPFVTVLGGCIARIMLSLQYLIKL